MRPTLDPAELKRLRTGRQYHEDYGPVLWWRPPIDEAPYCGTPGDSDWPGYHTHWSPLPNVFCPKLKKHISPEGKP